MRALRLIVLSCLGAGLLACALARPPALTTGGMDFNAFYCAARALSNGANPYRYEPLHSCEHATRHWPRSQGVVPAPLPPYALAVLIPLARAPYAQSGLIWFVILIASMFVVTHAVLRLANLPLLVVGTSFSLSILIQALPTGSLAPIALALLCAAALALTRQRWNAAAACLGFACIEPHVTLPVLLVSFVVVREMRVRIALVVLALIAVSLAAGGIGLNLEYVSRVLPEHARFELGSIAQFGLSSMLHNVGVPDGAALFIGSVQYAVFALAGIWLVRSLGHQDRAMVVLVPMALAVTGGTYIHLSQVVAVLPLAFVVASRTRSKVAWAGIVLLTVPWNLLNAMTPNALLVPRLDEVVSTLLVHQSAPGEYAYIANALIYLGIACTYCSLFFGRNRRLELPDDCAQGYVVARAPIP